MIEATSKISSKGQVVIPIEIRKRLNIMEGDSLKFTVNDDGDISVEAVKRDSILELFGSITAKGDTKNFKKVSYEAKKEHVEHVREKMEK